MGLCRRSIRKLKTTAPLRKSTSLNTYSNSRRSKNSDFFQPVLRNSVLKNNQRYKFHNFNSRFFYRTSLLGLLGCGAAYYWNLERVPYTNRSHFVLFSTSLEKKLGDLTFERYIESAFKGERLPPLHPSSIRVERIGKDIVEAAQKGLRKEEESLIIKFFKKLGKRDYHQIPQFEWEFVVIDEPQCNAHSYLGGKITIFTGYLHTFESDAEIAAAIAHEVSHSIARHYPEHLSRLPGLAIFMQFLDWAIRLHLKPAISKFLTRFAYSQRRFAKKVFKHYWLIPITTSVFLIWFPDSRRREKEADYIGLNLMAAAGYDPRVAPHMYKKMDDKAWPLKDYVATHPCGKTRAKLLSQPKVMDEALSLYREVQALHDVA